VSISGGLGSGTISGTTANMLINITLATTTCGSLAFTALPLTAAENNENSNDQITPAADTITDEWDDATLIVRLLRALQTSQELRDAVRKAILTDE
jgi:hypothetical protein